MKLPIYMDYMATTPVDPRVAAKMSQCLMLDGVFGNPASRTHIYGWQAEESVEKARQYVADLIGADSRELVFTSGATEAINLALKGAAKFYQRKGKHIITCETEHKAVLDTCKYLEGEGFSVTYLRPEENGLIRIEDVKKAITKQTILISLLHVNNEIGVIQDIAAVAKLTREHGIIFHVDGAQSVGKIPVDVKALQVDLMSLSAHKMYGPKGVGTLYVCRQPRARLEPLIHGGGHEKGLRSGTLATHQIVGMGEACRIAKRELLKDGGRILKLRKQLWQGISVLKKVRLNGDEEQRVPGNLNVGFAGVDGEALMMALKDIAVSSGSACTSATIEPSHVLHAIGLSDELAHSSIRFSIGRFTTEEEVDFAVKKIKKAVTRLREMSPLWKSDEV